MKSTEQKLNKFLNKFMSIRNALEIEFPSHEYGTGWPVCYGCERMIDMISEMIEQEKLKKQGKNKNA